MKKCAVWGNFPQTEATSRVSERPRNRCGNRGSIIFFVFTSFFFVRDYFILGRLGILFGESASRQWADLWREDRVEGLVYPVRACGLFGLEVKLSEEISGVYSVKTEHLAWAA
ncbi:MAG: hypothetical protein WCK89_04295 [bacterium]